jgi:hypothetical protein
MLLVGESLKKGDNFNVHELNYFRESIQFHNIHADALNFIPKLAKHFKDWQQQPESLTDAISNEFNAKTIKYITTRSTKLRCSNNIPYLYWSQNNSWNMSINVSDVQITITRLNRASPI